ncbi:MAG: two-component regulator propeller domain-containing protein [Candidatus Aminicenantes bacterium]
MLYRIPYTAKKSGSLFLLLSILFSTGLYCQKTRLQFQQFTIEQGLAQNSVFCILQGQKGLMWFGTEQGLNRFDGYTFVVHKSQYNNPNSLNNSFILSFHQDADGIFWIGTNGGGLNRFDPEKHQFSHYLVDPESIDSLNNIINVIFEDSSGELWIGSGGGGLKKFSRKSKIFTHFPVKADDSNPLNHNTINAVYQDHLGTLWIGTDGGLKQLNRGMNQIEPVGMIQKKVLAIYEDKHRQLWLGTDNGFYRFEPNTRQLDYYQVPCDETHFYRANRIRVFYEDRLETFWIGSEYGLHIFDRRDKTYSSYYADLKDPHSLINNRINAIYEDRSGALWVGLRAGGLCKLNRTEQNFVHYYNNPQDPDSLIMRGVFAIYRDREGVLWIGTYGEGLIAFNRKSGEFINYRHHPQDANSLSDNKIWSICEDGQGMIWVGTAGGGLNRFSRKTGKFSRYLHQPQNPNSLSSDFVSCIIEDGEENLWIATNGGLDQLDPQRKQFVHYKNNPKDPNTLVHNNVYVICQDQKGILWIGTKGGLSRFDPISQTFTSYSINAWDQNSLISSSIYSLWEDRQGVMWIGTTNGLIKFDPNEGTFFSYTENEGLPNDVINGILEDHHGNFWLSTNKGVSRFNPGTGKFKNYGVADGLQSLEFSAGCYFKGRNEELFFGGLNGFNAFFPDSVIDNPYIPPVVITDFKIFDQSVPVGKEVNGRVILEKSITWLPAITLSHQHHTFSLEFAALNYIHSQNNEYAYMMEGLEEDWNYFGKRRFVTYANLAPGDYIFRVKASNNHGIWNEDGVSLKIRVLPPFWVTWWFRAALFILVVVLIFAAYRVRTRLILRRNQELEDMVDRRTSALKESEEKYRIVVERAHNGIIILQGDVIVFNNQQFSQLLGYDDSQVINRPVLQLVVPEKQPEVNEFLALYREAEKSTGTFETILRHKDGRDIPVSINSGPIKFRKQPALLMFFHDIRMQKWLEEERMKTVKLESTRILAGGIAHDFNNLLAMIIGNVELALEDAAPGERMHKALVDAEKSAMKAVDLTRQFIMLSKGNTLIKKTVFIQDIIQDAVDAVLQDSLVTSHIHLAKNLWPVDCDARQIKQAIENVVINAAQAMSNNGVLEVNAENEELAAGEMPNQSAGKYVCITIKDNGIGISQEDLPKIFDPYFSTRDDVTQKGLGLGLTVVHSIISRHKGIITVSSEVGVGTTVRICLPPSDISINPPPTF